MWGPHNRRGRKGNSRDHRRSPRRRSPACGRSQSLEKRQCRRGAATPLHDPGADLNPKPQGPVHGDSCAAGMAGRAAPCFTRSARPGGPGFRDGRRRHTTTPSRDGKTGQCGPRTPPGARSLSFASYSPSGTHGQRKHPDRPPAPRDTARPRHASLLVQVKRAGRVQARDGGPETGPRRARQRVLQARTRACWPSPGT